MKKFAPPNKIKVVVTADHATPCKLKAHSADPVPVLFYNDSIPKTGKLPFVKVPKDEKEVKGKKFCEEQAKRGALGRFKGRDLLKKVGFVR